MRTYTRHQLKQDQFTAGAKETVSWVVEHRQKLIYIAGALAVVVAVVLGLWAYYQQQDEGAGVALGHAIQVYQAPITGSQPAVPDTTSFATVQDRAKAARAEFAKVAGTYSHTRSGALARYFMGVCDADAGNTTAAEQELKQVASSRDQDLAALAKFALASLAHQAGRDDQAIALYKDLIDHPSNTVGKPSAQLALAAIYETKQPADARAIYQQVQKDEPQSPAAEIAANRLASVRQ
ncbi:MAG: tetratricopeptide repeat protein [Terriglobales bacterium]